MDRAGAEGRDGDGVTGGRARAWLAVAARFLLAAALLLAPWPGLPGLFVRGFAAVAQSLGFDVRPIGPESWEAALRVVGAGGEMAVAVDTRRGLYLPLAVFTAFCAAAPMPAPRRRLLVWGVGLAALQLLPSLTFALVAGPQTGFVPVLVGMGYKVLVAMPGMAYAVPGLLFVALWSGLERRPAKKGATARGRRDGVTARRWSSARGSSSSARGRPRS